MICAGRIGLALIILFAGGGGGCCHFYPSTFRILILLFVLLFDQEQYFAFANNHPLPKFLVPICKLVINQGIKKCKLKFNFT